RQVINSRGEIFFSKLIVLFEGETEEQIIPIFFNHHFKKSAFEMGIDFVGVGGHGNYPPFLHFAESLNIPWLILSDAEINVKEKVNKQLDACGTQANMTDRVVFLDDANNIERQLIADGFQDEIKNVLIKRGTFNNEQHKVSKENEIKTFDDDELYKQIKDDKAQLGSLIAEQIVKSGKSLPPKILELFKKITSTLRSARRHYE
ncbi:MAG: hypothetical protein KZQ68_16550, partial [gamma proteobacterium symbiont of Bathyaustriella thionipta]|nr:hypothetical protein [gamma proteobacterium symbiont of Bathyaustriella thionipta]